MTGLKVLYKKEMNDSLLGKRFYIIFGLMLVVTVASLIGAFNAIEEADFLSIYTTAGSSLYSFTTFLGFLGPLIGIFLGFDTISNERSQRTLTKLASQPIYRDSIINAKFLSGVTVIGMIVFFMGLMVCGASIIIKGVYPDGESFARLLIFLLVSVVYISEWLALSIIFSTVSKHSATAAITVFAIWLVLTLFWTSIASGLANILNPVNQYSTMENVYANYNLQLSLCRISPYYLFTECYNTILNPGVRTLNLTSMSAYSGAVEGPLSLGQSVLLIWPHIVAMCAIVIAGFAIAYVNFMKQEIRA